MFSRPLSLLLFFYISCIALLFLLSNCPSFVYCVSCIVVVVYVVSVFVCVFVFVCMYASFVRACLRVLLRTDWSLCSCMYACIYPSAERSMCMFGILRQRVMQRRWCLQDLPGHVRTCQARQCCFVLFYVLYLLNSICVCLSCTSWSFIS